MSRTVRAWAAWIGIGVVHVGAIVLSVTHPSQPGTFPPGDIVTTVVAPILYASLGLLMLVKKRGRIMGWLFMAVPFLFAGAFLAQEWAIRALITSPGSLAGGRVAATLNQAFAQLLSIALGLLVMLFPDGRPLNRFWRGVAGLAVLSGIASTIIAVLSDAPATATFRQGVNFGVGGLGIIHDPKGSIAWFVGQPGVVAGMSGILAVLLRFRRAKGDERLQLRWLAWTLGSGITFLLVSGLPIFPSNTNTVAGAVLVLGIPAGAGIAVLKYRLYEIDVVISKTLVYTALAAFVTGLYVAIVAGAGRLAGRGDEPTLAASIVATAVVAMLFQPVRERLQRVANRLVFGERATPYQVLARISRALAEAGTSEELLARMAETLAGGTGATRTAVWLRSGSHLKVAASWPAGATAEQVPSVEQIEADLTLPVIHDGETLGALSIVKAADERMTSTERSLAEHLASQAGLVLRNARLTADLRVRLEELRASRQRLVKAQNEARRRIERDLHDGAQQEIVALKIKLGIAAQIADPDTAEKIAALQRDVGEALEGLRALARGIYPPLLASDGLGVALRSHAAKLPFQVAVEADLPGRYDQEVESTVYFCVLEALRFAGPATTVHVEQVGDHLTFQITGLDRRADDTDTTGMADRLAALDGRLELISTPERGVSFKGSVPAIAPVAAARG